MDRIRYLNKEDKDNFEHISKFPGEEGNPFDHVLRILQKINSIPSPLFIVFLFLISGFFTLFDLENWSVLYLFSILDSLILLLLPFLKISFGSFKSQVLLLILLRAIFIWFPYPVNLIFQVLGTFLVIYGFIIEPSRIKVTELNRTYRNGYSSIHFIHLADIHLEKISIREGKILNKVKELMPDFILFTGDFLSLSFNRDSDSINQVISLFNQLNTIAPVYYVSGSPAVDLSDVTTEIENKISATRLHNRNIIINKNGINGNLIGITCTHKPHEDIKKLNNLIEKDQLNILMYHSPDLIYEIEREEQIHLMLAGHTHGGQVRIPFWGALFTGSLYGRKLQCGMYQMYDTLLYISRGIGLEGMGAPRVRFLCSPEIIDWKIYY